MSHCTSITRPIDSSSISTGGDKKRPIKRYQSKGNCAIPIVVGGTEFLENDARPYIKFKRIIKIAR